MSKIKVALFGLSHPHVGTLHSAVAQHPKDFEVISFSEVQLPSLDPDYVEHRRASLRDKCGVREYADWHELIAQKPDYANGAYRGVPFEQHRYMYRNIINTIAGREEFLVKEHQNLEVAKAIECFYKSAEWDVRCACAMRP